MKYRPLGRTGVRVSQLGLGTMPFGGDTDEDEAGAIVAACLDVGINLFDCADVYTGGRAETILGRLIAPVRDDVVLATKVGFPSGPGVNRRGTSAAHVRLSVEESLARLGTDRIDLYYLHRFDRHTDIEHTLRTLDALVTGGKILHIGVSNFAAWQVATALGLCALHGWAPIVALQPMYNLVKRQVEVELLPLAQSADLAVFPYSPLAGGLLTGKYGTTPGSGEGRLVTNQMYRSRYRDEGGFVAAAELAALAAEIGCHPATLAVAWVGSHPGVTAPLIGGRSLEQLRPSLAAVDFELDDELRGRISALTPDPPPATDRSEESAGD
jgi:aryl-alcohol dehydrogenase-like predicted oxidoreductase